MKVTVNGEIRALNEGHSLLVLLDDLALASGTVVVERNGDIVPREEFEAVLLADGDVLELVRLVGGG